jgi:hypothetical protein
MARVGVLLLTAILVSAGIAAQETATVAREAEVAMVQKVLEVYGAAPVIQWIQQRRYGKITVEVGGKLKPAVGPPNAKFVTPASVLHDLKLLHVDTQTFAAEIATAGPVEKRDLVISQDDVGPAGRDGATTTGSRSSGGARTCREMSEQAAIRIASARGCNDGKVLDVAEEGEDQHVMFSVFEVRGECRTTDFRVRHFIARIKCTSSPTARLTVESPNGLVEVPVNTSQLSFRITD